MEKRFKIGVLISLSSTLFVTAAPTYAGNDTSWIPTDKNYSESTVHSFAFMDRLPLPQEHSVLSSWNDLGSFVCKSTSDPACSTGNFFQYTSILKACVSQSDTDCISQLSAIDANGLATAAKFSRYSVTDHINAFPADTKAGIPQGSMPSIWSIPSAPHASGSDYAVFAGIHGIVDRNGIENSLGSFMQLSLIPVTLKDFGNGPQSKSGGWSQSISGIYYDYCANSQEIGKPTYTDCSHVNGDSCLFATNDQGKCYVEEAFGPVQKFNVQLKLSKEPTGWMHGRMVDPLIAITKAPSGGINLSVTAGTTSVPMVYQTGTWASLPSNLKDLWVKCGSDLETCGGFWLARAPGATSDYINLLKTIEGNAGINVIKYVDAFGKLPLEIMAAISPLVGNKASASSSTWSMRTLSNAEMNGANMCFTKTPGLKGIVTTNSTAYSAGPPEFKDGSLNYQVSSPHFNSDGVTPFKGNYNLVMRSDVARCIYGFSSAPIQATISVLSSEGTADISTSVTSEKNGWLALSANNFQFSAPIIQVKLSQPSMPVKATPKKITCVKGKVSKVVTMATCPKGYLKK